MQNKVRRRPDTQDLVRAYKARFGDQAVPESDEEMRATLGWDESMDRLKRDERVASIPAYFDLYEDAERQDERIRRTRADLAALLVGDPEEHRETWEMIRPGLDGDETCSAAESPSTT